MVEDVKHLAIIKHSISEGDANRICPPFMIGEIKSIYLKNTLANNYLTMNDAELAYAKNVTGQRGDQIIVLFTLKKQEEILVTMQISSIFLYSCNIGDISDRRKKQQHKNFRFGRVWLRILDIEGKLPGYTTAKLHVNIQLDILNVHADEVVISDITYRNKEFVQDDLSILEFNKAQILAIDFEDTEVVFQLADVEIKLDTIQREGKGLIRPNRIFVKFKGCDVFKIVKDVNKLRTMEQDRLRFYIGQFNVKCFNKNGFIKEIEAKKEKEVDIVFGFNQDEIKISIPYKNVLIEWFSDEIE